jgi:site-specific DNA-adenine methylase
LLELHQIRYKEKTYPEGQKKYYYQLRDADPKKVCWFPKGLNNSIARAARFITLNKTYLMDFIE